MTSTADRVDDIDYQIWIGTVVTVVAAFGVAPYCKGGLLVG